MSNVTQIKRYTLSELEGHYVLAYRYLKELESQIERQRVCMGLPPKPVSFTRRPINGNDA